MARKPRIHFTGAFYHIMLHGKGGQAIFFGPVVRNFEYGKLKQLRNEPI